MGWREVIIQTVWDYTGCTDARAETTAAGIEDRLADMPPADRIALARELLAGTGRVVARELEPFTEDREQQPFERGFDAGWNEAIDAMLGDEG
jgi:hypothetical protein